MRRSRPASFARYLIPVSIIIAIALTSIGLRLDREQYVINLVAGFASNFMWVIVTILLVDRYAAHQMEQQQAHVRKLAYRGIAAHLCDAVSEMFYLLLPFLDDKLTAAITAGRDQPSPDTAPSMRQLAKHLREVHDSPDPKRSLSDCAVGWYEDVRWDLDQIQQVLTPRFAGISADQPLIDALAALDDQRRVLHNHIIAHERIVLGGVYEQAVELLERAADAYGVLQERWTEENEAASPSGLLHAWLEHAITWARKLEDPPPFCPPPDATN